MEEFTEIRRFVSMDMIEQVVEILDDNHIEHKIEDTSYAFDITFTNSQTNIEYILKVRNEDAERAEALLNSNFTNDLNDEEYHLNAFSDEELSEVVTNPDEWSSYDVEYARKLISKRGIKINEKEISLTKEKKLEELQQGIKAKAVVLFFGYLLSITGGLLGLIVAINLRYTKNVRAGGEKFYYYDKESRLHGAYMLMIFGVWALISAVYIVYLVVSLMAE
jgi:hypothetical protein